MDLTGEMQKLQQSLKQSDELTSQTNLQLQELETLLRESQERSAAHMDILDRRFEVLERVIPAPKRPSVLSGASASSNSSAAGQVATPPGGKQRQKYFSG